jgi:acyl-CoA reductase-like NAD-dependent aldehyde dehydrogenase
VVNTVNGRGRAGCGKHFLAGIDKGHFQAFSFVGSMALGRHVGELCGRNLILPDLDLVGRGTMVVMPDADLDQAAQDALQAAFAQAGQRPLGLVNLLLHEGCAPAFKQRFLDLVAALEVGNPMTDPDVAYGPLINARAATAFREHWDLGQEDGATLLCGGEQWTEANRTGQVKGNISHGAYMQPCVWEGVTPAMGLFRNQVLGPMVCLSTCKDFDEALAWAQGAPAVSFYGRDSASIRRFQQECRADITRVNSTADDPETRLAFAGQGTRPGSRLAFDAYLRWQAGVGQQPEKDQPRTHPETLVGSFKTDWASL